MILRVWLLFKNDVMALIINNGFEKWVNVNRSDASLLVISWLLYITLIFLALLGKPLRILRISRRK